MGAANTSVAVINIVQLMYIFTPVLITPLVVTLENLVGKRKGLALLCGVLKKLRSKNWKYDSCSDDVVSGKSTVDPGEDKNRILEAFLFP